ncbi:MAG: (Fe-S)-binding protein [Pirellulaceae bacterium]
MHIGLFVPCYVDQLYPQVGLATVEILEKCGVAQISFPEQQTCCGQPMANTGCTDQTRPLALQMADTFRPFDYVVSPSGSCVAMVRHHYEEYFEDKQQLENLTSKTFELCEFLTDVLKVSSFQGSYPRRVGLHQSCHGLRELRMGSSSEIIGKSYNKTRQLLAGLDGIDLVTLSRVDECCGFGGTFAVNEEAVSCAMGKDRIDDHQQAGAEVMTAADMSCLMHLSGMITRAKVKLEVLHIAEILRCFEPNFETASQTS